jgi:type I restriction enzyme S subunit
MADDKEPKEQQGLPEGWKWVKLGEVIEEVRERNLSNDQLPLLTSSRKGIYLQDEYFNRIVASENLSNYKVIRKGQFTYRSMSDDGTFVFNRLENMEVGLVSPAYYVFQVRKGYSGSFLKYFINNSIEVKKQIYKEIEGTTRTALRFNQLKNFIVPLPPLSEQRKIAQILETVDNAIEKTEKIIEKYKRIKQGLMQDLLTKGIDEKGNIRSEKTHKFKDSPLGRIPEEWEVVRLGEILKFLKGKTPRKLYDYEEEGMTIYLTPEYLRKNNCDVAFCKKEETLLANEDIIILWDGSNAGEVFWAEKGAVASTMAKIDITSSDFPIYKKFLYYYLKSNEFVFKYQVKGSGIPHFEKDILNTLNSVFPPLSEQKRIAEILSQIDQAIEKEEKYKEKLERLKKGLMEDLLTGKVRVNKLLEGESHEMA